MDDRHEPLRAEVRRFVAAHRVDGIDQIEAHPPHEAAPSKAILEWTARLRAGGWLCLSWPPRFGGRGLTPLECAVVNDEFARAGAPRVVLGIGERLVAPTLFIHGTDRQRERVLPGILSGTDWWCQGFSEPEAGSDLASLRTRGEVRGNEITVTGQKVWTSEAHLASHMFLLCRTDGGAERHRGLSVVLLDMRQPGVEVRPLRQAHGAAGFNEVFLDGAIASLDDVVGGLGHGWQVANTTLGAERGGDATTAHIGYEREWRALVAEARAAGTSSQPGIRHRLVDAWIGVELLRYWGLRQFAAMQNGEGVGSPSLFKVMASEHHRRFGELAMDVLGPAAMLVPPGPGYAVDRWQRVFFESRSRCISRGTNEIQRNLVAERALGLPKG